MQYPLELTFKFWAITPQISVVDAQGQQVFYVRQKLFKLKEAISVFADTQRSQLNYTIKADRIIDWSARYTFRDRSEQAFGAVKRRGWKSIWRARYDIFQGEEIVFTIQEEDPWVKVFDYLFSEVPILGMFTGYVFNPAYEVSRPNGTPVMRLEKRPALWSRLFTIKKLEKLEETEESSILMSLLMLILLERSRG